MPFDHQPRRHLWAGPKDHGADHGWMEPDPVPAATQGPAPQGPPPKVPSRRGPVLVVLGVLALAFVSIAVGSRLEGGDAQSANVVTLPVVNGTTPATRAGEIYEATKEGVVQIRAGDSSGTGFVVDTNGTIVTNAHVVESTSDVRVVFDDGISSVEGKVLGRDVSADLAVVKVDPSDVKTKVVALALADSDKVKTGDEVLAVGYPLGLDRTATSGIISGIGRQIKAQNGFSIDKVLQTDASINPGNSGGPLLDARGRVIGVNSQIAATASGGNTGIGFSIPSNTVRTVIPALVAGKSIARPYLGVSLTPTDDDSGARVAQTTPGGPGDDAKLVGNELSGDVITALNGTKITDPDSLIATLDKQKPGDKITLDVRRGGRSIEIEVTVGERPATANAGSSTGVDPNATPTTPELSPFGTP